MTEIIYWIVFSKPPLPADSLSIHVRSILKPLHVYPKSCLIISSTAKKTGLVLDLRLSRTDLTAIWQVDAITFHQLGAIVG